MRGQPVVLFASAIPRTLERKETLPARFVRLLEQLPLQKRVLGKVVAIKMHVGGAMGYSTIHPLFVKVLVDHIRAGNPKTVFVTDGSVTHAAARGYARETVGARLVPAVGVNERNVLEVKTGWEPLPCVLLSRPVLKADILINFSHVKGHGDAAYGGACKNLAMGLVPDKTRKALHRLEGRLEWDEATCVRCKKCLSECTTRANRFNENGQYEIFWHHCRLCLHCMLVCPTKAIRMVDRRTELFQEGLARVAKLVIDRLGPRNVFHINVLTHITIFCDCWGMTTPALVPDIGILASQDIVAVEDASLRMIKTENVIPGSITPPYKLGKGRHLFERLHGKDPFRQVAALERIGAGSTRYRLVEVDGDSSRE